MNPWETVLLAFGGNALLLAVLGVLARSLLSQYITKDFKRFETELAQRTQFASEELKHRLALAAHEHSVRFSKLHEKQAQVIEDVYSRILNFEEASAALSLASNSTPENLLEFALCRAEDAGRELSQYIRRHEIFLPATTSVQLHALLDRVNTLLSACSLNLVDKKLDGNSGTVHFPEHREAWTTVHHYLENEAPVVRKSLETEFRRCLGAAQ